MKKAHEFDLIFDSQSVFRCLLTAFSNPGRVVDFSQCALRLNTPKRAFLAVAAALVDNETTFFTEDDAAMGELIAEFTYGRRAAIDNSDFIFIQQYCNVERIRAVCQSASIGTLSEPNKSSTIFVRVESFLDTEGVSLEGPGIDGQIMAPLCAQAVCWVAMIREMGIEYPCGLDIAFVTDDAQLIAVPRLVKIASAAGNGG